MRSRLFRRTALFLERQRAVALEKRTDGKLKNAARKRRAWILRRKI